MQITVIEANSEAKFPKLREYCHQSAEGTRAGNTPATEGKIASLLIDYDSHYLFCYTSNRNGDGINLIICVILH